MISITFFTRRIIANLIAAYLLKGAIVVLLLIFDKLGFMGLVSYLIPTIISVFIWVFHIVSAILFLLNNKSIPYCNLLITCLFVQSIQFKILGLSFQNYFGPYIGVKISVLDLDFDLVASPFTYFSANGYDRVLDGNFVIINLAPVILLLIMTGYKRSMPGFGSNHTSQKKINITSSRN